MHPVPLSYLDDFYQVLRVVLLGISIVALIRLPGDTGDARKSQTHTAKIDQKSGGKNMTGNSARPVP
jgi:hypothetical protein